VPELVDVAMQTNWKYPKNAVVQCEPRELTDSEKLVVQESEELAEFVRNVAQRFVVCILMSCIIVCICVMCDLTSLSRHLSPSVANSVRLMVVKGS